MYWTWRYLVLATNILSSKHMFTTYMRTAFNALVSFLPRNRAPLHLLCKIYDSVEIVLQWLLHGAKRLQNTIHGKSVCLSLYWCDDGKWLNTTSNLITWQLLDFDRVIVIIILYRHTEPPTDRETEMNTLIHIWNSQIKTWTKLKAPSMPTCRRHKPHVSDMALIKLKPTVCAQEKKRFQKNNHNTYLQI